MGDWYTFVVSINGWEPNNTFFYIGLEHNINFQFGVKNDTYWNDTGVSSEYYIGDKVCGFVGNVGFVEMNQGASYLNSGQACQENCKTVIGQGEDILCYSNTEATCENNFVRDDYTTLCIKCDSICKSCAAHPTHCSSCHSGYFLLNDTCVDHCPDPYYHDHLNNSCTSIELIHHFYLY